MVHDYFVAIERGLRFQVQRVVVRRNGFAPVRIYKSHTEHLEVVRYLRHFIRGGIIKRAAFRNSARLYGYVFAQYSVRVLEFRKRSSAHDGSHRHILFHKRIVAEQRFILYAFRAINKVILARVCERKLIVRHFYFRPFAVANVICRYDNFTILVAERGCRRGNGEHRTLRRFVLVARDCGEHGDELARSVRRCIFHIAHPRCVCKIERNGERKRFTARSHKHRKRQRRGKVFRRQSITVRLSAAVIFRDAVPDLHAFRKVERQVLHRRGKLRDGGVIIVRYLFHHDGAVHIPRDHIRADPRLSADRIRYVISAVRTRNGAFGMSDLYAAEQGGDTDKSHYNCGEKYRSDFLYSHTVASLSPNTA